jgi:LacI family transcriptional regulator
MNLKELSAHLDLSPTTVSRALNGYPEVNEATRRRVRGAAAEHGYHPSTRAKNLATGQSFTIGHVIPISTKHELLNPILTDFLAGASEAYERAGYDLLLLFIADLDEDRAYRELVTRGKVDGIIVHGPKLADTRIGLLNELEIPFVVHGRSTQSTQDYNWVDVNSQSAFHRGAGFLLDLGHRRIALLNGLEIMDFATRRRDGYLDALNDRGVSGDPAIMAHAEMTEGFGYTSAESMLASDNPPTAFMVSSIIMAIGVRRAIEETGRRLGKDISVIVFDDDLSYFRSSGNIPFFTSLRSSVRDAGQIAAEMLLEQIRDRTAGPKHNLLQAELTVGQSTGPVRKA